MGSGDSERMLRSITHMHEQKTKKNTRFNEVQQSAFILGVEGREILLIKSLLVTNKNTSLFNIYIENPRIKGKSKLKNRIRIQIRN